MENETLTGIERDLVIQYLIDGNIPVTLTPLEEEKSTYNYIHSVNSQIFPIALKPDNIKVEKNGKIILENPPSSVIGFTNKEVKVEFYFNRVGLFFVSTVKNEEDNYSISVPDVIHRIKDVVDNTEYDFSVNIYINCNNKQDTDFYGIPWKNETLFTRPVWKSIPLENQQIAKKYLEKFVEVAKVEKNAGNGIQLVPICNYLTTQIESKVEALQDRRKPLSILYVDHERIVLGNENKDSNFLEGCCYGLKLSFSIKNSPILSRDIFVLCNINKIYSNEDKTKSCLDFVYTTIQEEDLRYLYEKATKHLFI